VERGFTSGLSESDAGYWILDAGYWMLDTGYWILDQMNKFNLLLIIFVISQNIANAKGDTTILVGSVPVDFKFPYTTTPSPDRGRAGVGAVGAILVLPGWNFGKNDVCLKSDFCTKALSQGFILVLPEMLKSIYASELFPETRSDYRRYPTMKWITDTLIPFCQAQFRILGPGGNNFLYGISTGARGVALVAENTGNLFLSGAALSGDYDQTTMPADRLMTGYYGSYAQFKDRWEGPDNPSIHSDRLKIPLYLAHGIKDAVVPIHQTIKFSEKILAENPHKGHEIHLCGTCGHNYAFWNSQTDAVLLFFLKHKK
jgi:pimeloyl-ACP methyl ester carboxylesterase